MSEDIMSRIYIAITTYNRPRQLRRLLESLARYSHRHDVSVHVYDDGSTEDYGFVEEFDVRYVKTSHHGKEQYWRLITQVFEDIRPTAADYYVLLPDDAEPVEGFLDLGIRAYETIADQQKICLSLLTDSGRLPQPRWGSSGPTRVEFAGTPFYRTQWVDMLFIARKAFFEAVKYRIDPISPGRWKGTENELSSGVGQNLSRRLSCRYHLYHVERSLVHHGAHRSMMNPEIRRKHPIITCPITASVASIPSRHRALCTVVERVLPQVSRLFVYLNNYERIPDFLQHPHIVVNTSQEHGDLGDTGKLFGVDQTAGYRLLLDDDLLYPEDYVRRMLEKIEDYERRVCVGVHGVILRPPVNDYHRDRDTIHYREQLNTDRPVHLLGTGTLAYHTDTIRFTSRDCEVPNMADIWTAVKAQRSQVGMICVARNGNWLRSNPAVNHRESIFERHHPGNGAHLEAIRRVGQWEFYA